MKKGRTLIKNVSLRAWQVYVYGLLADMFSTVCNFIQEVVCFFKKKWPPDLETDNMLHRHVSRDNHVICKQSSEAAKILFLQILVLYCSCRFSL